MVYNISFPDSSIGSADSGWHSIHHEAIPHDDWYRLPYSFDNIQNTFSAEFQGFHGVPEIDPATGSSALSLVAGVLAMIEQRRRRVALVA